MSFGSRLRERREELGLKQSELGKMLGITGSAIGNYENGISSPKADILYQVFDVLKCDANYLFQDEMKELESEDFTVPEIKMVKKYRLLDPYGKEAVDGVLDVESRRCEADRQAKASALRESREQMEAAEGAPAPSEMPTPFYEGGLEVSADELMKYVSRLNPGQQKMILEQAEKMIAARKELAVSSVPPKGGNTPPESDSPTQS